MFRKLIKKLAGLIPSYPYLSPQDQSRCRTHFLQVDTLQASLGMLFFLLLVVPSFANDYEFFGLSITFYLLLAVRIAIIIFSLLFITFIRKIKNYRVYDRIILLWQVISVITLLCVNLSRPADYYLFAAIDISIVSTMYIVFRSRLIIQATLATAFTLADLSIILLTKELAPPALRAIIAGYVLANCLGITALWMLNLSRLREFISHEQETAALKENQRLEAEKYRHSRMETIGSIAGGIAHDFNNVLTGIIGNVDMAAQALETHDITEAQQRLKDAMHASEQGRNLSSQIISFAGGSAPEMKTISLKEVIREAANFSLHGSSVKSQISLSEDLWPVEADRNQIYQVISNLVVNARQSMPNGGIIKVSARNITRGNADIRTDARFVMIQVEDNGPGMPPEKIARLFEPFSSSREGGYSMGLPVAYSIVKKHGGTIEAQSIMGAGTFFYVYLPASDKQAQPEKQARHGYTAAGNGHILLMDDDEAIKRLLTKGLQNSGYTAETAANGNEALNKFREAVDSGKPYDAAILDLTIPGGMGGLEAFREMQKLDPDIIAIASSGYSDDPVILDYRAYGFSGALIKPYTISVLLSMLDNALHRDDA